jgi:CheY-like chemotaxis protein
MPPDVAARILEPYFSTKGDKGTGLGLAVVSSVIADNGGALRLTTAQGQGTRFDVFWPTEASVPKQRAEQVISDMTGRLDGCTILVVDDQQEVLDVIAAYLEAAGAEVAPTSDPQDVVEALEDGAEHWDLLVTDFDMPGMTGAKLAEMAKARAPDLPVIVITALVAEAGRSDAAFTAVLPKPVDRDALVFEAELAIIQAKSRKG